MASTIQLKTGTGSAVPSSLTQGEVGINIDNGLIYYGSGSGNDVKQLESFTHITASGNISSSGTGENYFGGDVNIIGADLKLENNQKILFENSAGTEFGNIFMNTSDNMVYQNLRSNKDIFIRAGNGGNEGHVIIQKGGTETTIAKFGTTANLELEGNLSASGNIKADGFIENGKIPLIQYISTDATSTAQGRVLASSHNNSSDSFALEWDTPLFEDTDFFETGSVSPDTSGAINTFVVKQTGRYEINCNVAFHGLSGARPGINLGIFTSSAVSTVGDFRPAGPAAHAYVRVASPANGSTAAIPGFVIQLNSGSAVSMKVDLKDGFGATGNTLWSGSLSHFNMKKIG